MFYFILLQFISFPSREDSIIHKENNNNQNNIIVQSSGSLGVYYDKKCHQTSPNQTLVEDRKHDWCSNIGTANGPNPYITYSVKGKSMRIKGYSIRNGCCWYYCCCLDDNTVYDDIYCCCDLYSFSLLGSNDNSTWKTIHHVEKDNKFYRCLYKTYEFELTQPFKYVKLQLDEEYPKCLKCMQINEIDLYGETVPDAFSYEYNENEEEDTISIIGKVRKEN